MIACRGSLGNVEQTLQDGLSAEFVALDLRQAILLLGEIEGIDVGTALVILTEIGAKHKRARHAGRMASASPATGLASRHKFEQETLVKEALG